MNIPTPPPAYWDHVPWWAFVCLLALVIFLASPVALQVVRGRPGALLTREQAFVVQQDKLEARRAGYLDTLERKLHEADRELEEVKADRDEGWDLARGMQEVARDYRHQANGALAKVRLLLHLLREVTGGKATLDDVRRVLAEAPEPVDLPPVPNLREVERKQP